MLDCFFPGIPSNELVEVRGAFNSPKGRGLNYCKIRKTHLLAQRFLAWDRIDDLFPRLARYGCSLIVL